MAFPLDEVKYAVHIPDGDMEKQNRLDSFLTRVRKDAWSSVESLSLPDQKIIRGALIFAAVAAAQSTTDREMEDVIADFRKASETHDAVHGEPMSAFIAKYYARRG